MQQPKGMLGTWHAPYGGESFTRLGWIRIGIRLLGEMHQNFSLHRSRGAPSSWEEIVQSKEGSSPSSFAAWKCPHARQPNASLWSSGTSYINLHHEASSEPKIRHTHTHTHTPLWQIHKRREVNKGAIDFFWLGRWFGRWPVAGGRWPVGRWPEAGGRWPVAGGRWLVAGGGGRWPVAGGRRPVAGGPVAGGRWPVAGGRWPVAGGRWRWPVAGGRWPWPVAGGRGPVAGGRWPVAGVVYVSSSLLNLHLFLQHGSFQ